jgi:ribonuclease Z
MWFKFLGTSAGAPTRTRHVTGLALGDSGSARWILIDCGDGAQYRVMQLGLSLVKLQAICITHVHGDHCFGLPGLLATASMMGREAPLALIGPEALKEWVRQTLSFSESHLGFPLQFIDHKDFTSTEGAYDFNITSVRLSHRVPCFGFVFEERRRSLKLDVRKLDKLGISRGPQWGALQRGEAITLSSGEIVRPEAVCLPAERPRKCLVGGDNDSPECFEEAARGADLLIHEATYTAEVADRIGPATQHSSAARVAQFAQAVGLPNLVLTHFSPRYRDVGERALGSKGGKKASGYSVIDIQKEAQRYYQGALYLGEDLAHFYFDSQGIFTQAPA